MAFALALAGGVMLTVSVLEMFMPELVKPERWLEGAAGILIGFCCFLALKALVPEPHLHSKVDDSEEECAHLSPDGRQISTEQSGVASHDGSLGGEQEAVAEKVGADGSRGNGGEAAGEAQQGEAQQGEALEGEDECELGLGPNGGMNSKASARAHQAKQWRLAVLLTMALTAHNFPEGLAVAVSSMQSDRLGLVVMVAIAVHNIPEGIAIAMPVLDATGSRWKALQMATFSGLAEPLGAIVAVTLLPEGSTQGRGMDFLLCIVGGIMSCVAFTELIPEAVAQRRPLSMTCGMAAGALIMLLTHELA